MTQPHSSLKANKSFTSGRFSADLVDMNKTVAPSPRSSSANGIFTTDKPFLSCRGETKAAFENIVDNEKTNKESSRLADEDPTFTNISGYKEDVSDESEAVCTALTENQDVSSQRVISSVGSMDNALFTSRPQANRQLNYGERDIRKSLNEMQIKSCEMIEPVYNVEPRTSGQKATVNSVVNKQPNVCDQDELFIIEKGSNFSEDVTKTKNAVGLKYLFPDRGKIENGAHVIGGNPHVLEESHRVQSPFPSLVFLQSVENRVDNSLPISLTSFPGTQPPRSPSSTWPKHGSITGTPNLTTSYPSNSGRTDTTGNLTDDNVTRTQKTSTASDDNATRPGSQTRRSSVAASMLSSDVRDNNKKSSLGFTLIASLVKWKINTFHPPRKDGESIAKNAKHQEFMDKTADRIKTELPRPLLVSIQEEVYPIILRTAQAYRSQLGAKHKLTLQATARLEELIEELKNPY